MAEPTTNFSVETAVHWKALAHPLRLGILRLLTQRVLTNEELADALGVASGKLYFHTKMLLTAGLIEPAGTRRKGAITEKLYQASAQRFVALPAHDGTAAPLANAVAAGLALYQESWRQDPALTQLAYHLILAVRPERAQEFSGRLKQLAEDFTDAESLEAGACPLALTVLLHTVPALKQNGDASS